MLSILCLLLKKNKKIDFNITLSFPNIKNLFQGTLANLSPSLSPTCQPPFFPSFSPLDPFALLVFPSYCFSPNPWLAVMEIIPLSSNSQF